MRRPRFPHWRDLRAPRAPQPPGAAEAREYHALRLALFLSAGVHQSGFFCDGVQPLRGDTYEHFAWLRAALEPLEAVSPTVRRFRRLINVEGPRIGWDDPAVVRRHLHALRAEAARLATTLRHRGRRT